MNTRLWLGVFSLILSACGPTPQWVKPGATEADFKKTNALCDQENLHFGRRIQSMGQEPEEDVVSHRQNSYRRGGRELMQEQCLERHGWRLEYVE